MEQDPIKQLWKKHDQEIEKLALLNEQLLKSMISERSQSALERLRNAEYVIGCLSLLVLAPILMMMNQLYRQTDMIVSYVIVVAAFVATLVWSAYKLRYLARISISSGTVTDTAQRMERFRLFIIRERAVSLLVSFIVAPAAYLLAFRWIKHRNVWDHLQFSITQLVIVLVLSTLISLLIYNRAYLIHIRSILRRLREIEGFKSGV